MPDKRNTHIKSPVQRERAGWKEFVAVAVLAVFVAWASRDMWVDPLAPPYASGAETRLPDAQEEMQPSAAGAGAQPQRGSLAGLFSAGDYPMEALQRDEQGDVTAALEIDTAGRVTSCTVTRSSGSRSLDRRTCDILSKRARFRPQTDSQGRATAGSHTQRISWRLEG